MDEDQAELIKRLTTAAGMLMEDMSTLAITVAPQRFSSTRDALDALAVAATDMQTLISAAQVVHRRLAVQR